MLHSEGTMLATPIKLRQTICAPFVPHFVRAQSGGKIYRVGVLWLVEPQAWIANLFMDAEVGASHGEVESSDRISNGQRSLAAGCYGRRIGGLANALGVTMPRPLLLSANQVIR